jgi:hypothetical protein
MERTESVGEEGRAASRSKIESNASGITPARSLCAKKPRSANHPPFVGWRLERLCLVICHAFFVMPKSVV